MTYIERLTELHACGEAVEFCRGHRSLQSAWDACERGDWMLWLLGRLSGPPESASRRKLVLAACQCARLALRYVRAGDMRPLAAIETAERWARGEDGVALETVRNATAAAYAAAAARGRVLQQCAEIVREAYPRAPRLRGTK